jgi:hypothetical protein
MSGIQEEFLIPFRPQDGALDYSRGESELRDGTFDTIAGGAMECRIADDAALAHLTFADFELRLDQYNHFPFAAQQRRYGGHDQSH